MWNGSLHAPLRGVEVKSITSDTHSSFLSENSRSGGVGEGVLGTVFADERIELLHVLGMFG